MPTSRTTEARNSLLGTRYDANADSPIAAPTDDSASRIGDAGGDERAEDDQQDRERHRHGQESGFGEVVLVDVVERVADRVVTHLLYAHVRVRCGNVGDDLLDVTGGLAGRFVLLLVGARALGESDLNELRGAVGRRDRFANGGDPGHAGEAVVQLGERGAGAGSVELAAARVLHEHRLARKVAELGVEQGTVGGRRGADRLLFVVDLLGSDRASPTMAAATKAIHRSSAVQRWRALQVAMATIGPRGRIGSGGVDGSGLGIVVVVDAVMGSPRQARLVVAQKPRRRGSRAQSGMLPNSG